MPARRGWTFRANHPASTPTTSPLNVEPMTMPTIPGATSGAERSALKPSKTRKIPRKIIPSTGLLTIHLSLSNAGSHRGEECDQGPHHDVGEHEENGGLIRANEPAGPFGRTFRVNTDGLR